MKYVIKQSIGLMLSLFILYSQQLWGADIEYREIPITTNLNRYVSNASSGEINLFLNMDAICEKSSWEQEFKGIDEPEPNYCGPTAVRNTLFWYGIEKDYQSLGQEMRTNTWDNDEEVFFLLAGICAGACGACALIPPAFAACVAGCSAAAYEAVSSLLKAGTLPQNVSETLTNYAPVGFMVVHGSGTPSKSHLLDEVSAGNPVIALIYRNEKLHWVTITGWYETGSTMKLRLGNNDDMKWEDFEEAWSLEHVTDVDAARLLLNELGLNPYVYLHYKRWNSYDLSTIVPDTDGDNWINACDNCPFVSNTSQSDADNDGYGDECDNCPSIANPNQKNADLDDLGDACDPCPESTHNAVAPPEAPVISSFEFIMECDPGDLIVPVELTDPAMRAGEASMDLSDLQEGLSNVPPSNYYRVIFSGAENANEFRAVFNSSDDSGNSPWVEDRNYVFITLDQNKSYYVRVEARNLCKITAGASKLLRSKGPSNTVGCWRDASNRILSKSLIDGKTYMYYLYRKEHKAVRVRPD